MPRELSRGKVVGWALGTIPAGALAGGLLGVVLAMQMAAAPHRYYAYRSSRLEELVVGASLGGTWALGTPAFAAPDPALAIQTTNQVDLCVWLTIVASLWLARVIVPALAPLGVR